MECGGCGHQISVIAGTIFEQSKKPLALWFRAIFEFTALQARNFGGSATRSISAAIDGMDLLHKIRTATIRPDRGPLSGAVEIDEVMSAGGSQTRAGGRKKAIAVAAVEKRGRGCGRVRIASSADVSATALLGFIETHLGPGETAHTDGWNGYASLGNKGYQHIVSVISQLDQTAAGVAGSFGVLAARVDPRHPQGSVQPQAPRRLPGGIHLPIQPPSSPPHHTWRRTAPRYRRRHTAPAVPANRRTILLTRKCPNRSPSLTLTEPSLILCRLQSAFKQIASRRGIPTAGNSDSEGIPFRCRM